MLTLLLTHCTDSWENVTSLVHYSDVDVNISKACHDKAIKYYTLGNPSHPDGWHDKGLAEVVLKAKLYYLSRENDQLASTLEKLNALLYEKDIYSAQTLNRLSSINIITEHFLSTCPWAQEDCYYDVIATDDVIFLHFNPLVLGYYILARVASKQGRHLACRSVISLMKHCDRQLRDTRQRESGSSVITLLQGRLTM